MFAGRDFEFELWSPTCQGNKHLAQACTKCISSQQGTADVASGSLVILNRNHAVNVREVGHLRGCHDSIVDLLMGQSCSWLQQMVTCFMNVVFLSLFSLYTITLWCLWTIDYVKNDGLWHYTNNTQKSTASNIFISTLLDLEEYHCRQTRSKAEQDVVGDQEEPLCHN